MLDYVRIINFLLLIIIIILSAALSSRYVDKIGSEHSTVPQKQKTILGCYVTLLDGLIGGTGGGQLGEVPQSAAQFGRS